MRLQLVIGSFGLGLIYFGICRNSSVSESRLSESKKTPLEKVEDIELLRALEIGQNIKTFSLKGDSFSVDVLDDYKRAEKQMNLDKFFRLYKI